METSSVAEELEKAQREYDAKFETYKSAHAEFQASRENLQKVEDDAKQRAYESVVETYVSVALDRNSKSKTTVPCSEHGGEKRARDRGRCARGWRARARYARGATRGGRDGGWRCVWLPASCTRCSPTPPR